MMASKNLDMKNHIWQRMNMIMHDPDKIKWQQLREYMQQLAEPEILVNWHNDIIEMLVVQQDHDAWTKLVDFACCLCPDLVMSMTARCTVPHDVLIMIYGQSCMQLSFGQGKLRIINLSLTSGMPWLDDISDCDLERLADYCGYQCMASTA